jgi:hypothetical protein
VSGFTREVKRLLMDAGCYFKRQGRGNHEIWHSPISERCFTVDGNIKSRHTVNKTRSDAGLPKSF